MKEWAGLSVYCCRAHLMKAALIHFLRSEMKDVLAYRRCYYTIHQRKGLKHIIGYWDTNVG